MTRSRCPRHCPWLTVLMALPGLLLTARDLSALAGAPDPDFGTSGSALVHFDLGLDLSDYANAMALQPDGKAIVVGRADTSTGTTIAVARLDENGALDPTFGSGGKATFTFDLAAPGFDEGTDVAVTPDGSIIIVGTFDRGPDTAFGILRLTQFGVLDPTFSGDGRAFFDFGSVYTDAEARAVAIQPDGKVLVCGEVLQGGLEPVMVAARLTANGVLDPTFGSAGQSFYLLGGAMCNDMALQPDGKIVMVGTRTTFEGDTDFVAIRAMPDGSADGTFGFVDVDFGLGNSFDEAHAVALDSQGRIVIAGAAESASNAKNMGVARLLPSGLLDSSFSGDGKTTVSVSSGNHIAYALAIQADDRILLAGNTQPLASLDVDQLIVRLRVDGALDPTFNVVGTVLLPFDLGQQGVDWATGIAVRPDGAGILVAGHVERTALGDVDFVLTQLVGDRIFGDDFEGGDLSRWTFAVPAP